MSLYKKPIKLIKKRTHKRYVQTPHFWEKFLEVKYILTEKLKQKTKTKPPKTTTKRRTPTATGWDCVEVKHNARENTQEVTPLDSTQGKNENKTVFHLYGLGMWACNPPYKWWWADPGADLRKSGLNHARRGEHMALDNSGRIPTRPEGWYLRWWRWKGIEHRVGQKGEQQEKQKCRQGSCPCTPGRARREPGRSGRSPQVPCRHRVSSWAKRNGARWGARARTAGL